MWFSLRLPLRFLRGSYSRLALTVIALACGVALVCAIDLVNRAVLRAFTEVIDNMAGRAALQVTAGPGGLFPEEVAATVAAVPGVELAVPVVSATAFTTDGSGELLTVHGVDITDERAVRAYEARDRGGLEIKDPLVFLSQPDSVVLTNKFAARHALTLEDKLDVATPTGRRTLTVRGLLEPRGIARVYGGNLIVMDIQAAEAAFTRPGFVNRVDIVVEREGEVERVAELVRQALPSGLRIEAPAQRKADLRRVTQSLQTLLQGIAMVGLLVAFLISFNRLSAVFEARMWQLGVLRAVGARAQTVWRDLIKESCLLALAGIGLGVPVGIGLGYLLLPTITTTTALNYKLVSPDPILTVTFFSLAQAILLGFGTALLAAAVPAWRVAGSALADIVRQRGIELPDFGGKAPRYLRVVAFAAIIVAVVSQALLHSATWGLVATACIAVAAALAARPLLGALEGKVRWVLNFVAGPTGRFAARAIERHPRRSALTVGMFGVGLAAVFWLSTVAHSFQSSVITTLGKAFQADLLVSSSYIASGFDDAPVSGDLVGQVRGITGVREVIGERILDWTFEKTSIAIDAFDSAYFRHTEFGRWELLAKHENNVWEAVAAGRGVVVSTSFLHNFGARVGQEISIETPAGRKSIQIVGVTSAFASPAGTIEMSRDFYREHWGDDQVTRVHVRAQPDADIGELRQTIARTFSDRYPLRILSSRELLDYWADQVQRAFAGVHLLASLILFVILVGMADTIAAGILERTRELGTFRAVGGRRRDVGGMILAESITLGMFGSAIAAVAGLGLAALWVKETMPLLLGWVLELHVPSISLIVVLIVTLSVCVLAALLPARRAARLDPAVALRYE